MAIGENARSNGGGACSGTRRSRRHCTNTTQTSHTEKTTTAGVWQAQSGHGETSQTYNQTQINGQVNIATGIRTTVLIPEGDLKKQVEALSQQPGLAYLGELAKDPKINWQQIKLAQDNWSYSQQGLTPAGAALLSIAVAVVTNGMGTELVGTTTATATGTATTLGGTTLATTTAATATTAASATTFAAGAAINAGFSALAAQAGVSLVNNGGDIGKTLQELGSSQSIKNTLTAMATAGVLNALGSTPTATGQTGANAQAISTMQAVDKFAANLAQNVTNNLASAVVSSAINGKPLNEETLGTALSSAFITAGMAQAANSIGDATQNGTLNAYTQAVAHALAGCVGGAATTGNSGGCSAGAVGAVVGELSANFATQNGMDSASALKLATTMSAAAGALVGGPDSAAAVNVASQMGANAALNNYLSHSEATIRAALKDKQAKGTLTASEQQQLTNLEVLDIARDLALKDACQAQGDACNAARRDLNAVIASYATAGAGYNARLSASGNQSVTDERNQSIALSSDPTLAQQTLWDSFKEFAGPQAAGYAAGAVLGKFITQAQAVYAAMKAEASAAIGAAAAGANGGVIRGFTFTESGIINEAQGILNSSELAKIQAAHAAGQPVTVNVGGRLIQYEPGLPASGMTMFGENGFLIGREAFTSPAELQQTILHELHRLTTSNSANGVSGALAAQETKAAADFAAKAVKELK